MTLRCDAVFGEYDACANSPPNVLSNQVGDKIKLHWAGRGLHNFTTGCAFGSCHAHRDGCLTNIEEVDRRGMAHELNGAAQYRILNHFAEKRMPDPNYGRSGQHCESQDQMRPPGAYQQFSLGFATCVGICLRITSCSG